LEVPGSKFQAFCTKLLATAGPLEVWRRYNGRADIENRIKELGHLFGLKGLCYRSFWVVEAACHLAICDYSLCVGLRRRLGQPVRAEWATLRWRLFACAAVFSHRGRKPNLKLAVATTKGRRWWHTLL
jgi:hypothetical protein